MHSAGAVRGRLPTTPSNGKRRRRAPAVALLAPALLGLPDAAAAQIVRVPTVTVSPAHQFDIFPSATAGMGGVSIAVEDALLDPFVNPAKGSRIDQPRVLGSMGIFDVSDDLGGGWTLPMGALARSGVWFGGLLVGIQGIDGPDRDGGFFPTVVEDCLDCGPRTFETADGGGSPINRYGFAMLGRELEDLGLSLGGSVLWSGIEVVDGVRALFPGSVELRQEGHLVDVRLGALKEWGGGGTLEVLALHNRFETTHEARFNDAIWDPDLRQLLQRPRLERTTDRTSLWGLHLEYDRPIGAEGWRVGWLGTVNYQSHPAIADYETSLVSRDRGRSTALELGVGVGGPLGETSTIGADLVYEPIWSRTWATAPGPMNGPEGTIAGGEPVLDNRYRFSNLLLRVGFAEETDLSVSDVVGMQLGFALRSVGYHLSQRDHVVPREGTLRERWLEVTPTWGLHLRTPVLEVRYRGQATSGIHRPGLEARGGGGPVCFDFCVAAAVAPDVVARPGGPAPPSAEDRLSASVHQLSFSFPLGGSRRRAPAGDEGAGRERGARREDGTLEEGAQRNEGARREAGTHRDEGARREAGTHRDEGNGRDEGSKEGSR